MERGKCMGKVYLVGAGPGDPGLITLKGIRCIREADVILYDRLVSPQLLVEAKREAEIIYCGKGPDCHSMNQNEINSLLTRYAREGKIVTRLKGGDPFVYGRGGEEAEVLAKNHIAFEIVPGVTSGVGACAYAGIPLTHRYISSTVVFVTGHCCDEKKIRWDNIASIETVVIYMGINQAVYIEQQMISNGRSPNTPICIIQEGTTSRQRVLTGELKDLSLIIEKHRVKSPGLIVIGEVVRMRSIISWFM